MFVVDGIGRTEYTKWEMGRGYKQAKQRLQSGETPVENQGVASQCWPVRKVGRSSLGGVV